MTVKSAVNPAAIIIVVHKERNMNSTPPCSLQYRAVSRRPLPYVTTERKCAKDRKGAKDRTGVVGATTVFFFPAKIQS